MGYFSKLVVLVIAAVLIASFLTIPVSKMFLSRPYITEPEAGHVLSPTEVNDFVFIWNKAQNSYIKKYMGTASLRQDGKTSWLFRRWLHIHDWNVERFLYCEYRLNKLMNCVMNKNSYEGNKKISEKAGIALQDIIEKQKLQIADCNFDQYEYEMIADNIAILVKAMSDNN